MIVVILGMHRSGTSLVAHLLHQMGVNMGEVFLEADEYNPGGYWEDTEFLAVNKALLAAAGGDWRHPPSVEDMESVRVDLESEMVDLIKCRSDANKHWGWKDPRTCLTLPLWARYLDGQRYVVCRRKAADIEASLRRCHPEDDVEWGALIDQYYGRLMDFLLTTSAPTSFAFYEELVNPATVERAVKRLAEFVYADVGTAQEAGKVVRLRE